MFWVFLIVVSLFIANIIVKKGNLPNRYMIPVSVAVLLVLPALIWVVKLTLFKLVPFILVGIIILYVLGKFGGSPKKD